MISYDNECVTSVITNWNNHNIESRNYLPEEQSPQEIHRAIVGTQSIVHRLFWEKAGLIIMYDVNNVCTSSSTPITPFQGAAVWNFMK